MDAQERAVEVVEEQLQAANDASAPAHVEDEAPSVAEARPEPSSHSLLAVLMPANPPKPKYARIVRRFDLEAAKYDPPPPVAPAAAASAAAPMAGQSAVAAESEQSQCSRGREEARAQRNRSLAAAAGLI